MFWKKNETARAAAPAVVSRPEPVSLEVELRDEERAAYAQAAEAIGFCPGALLHEHLLGFLKARGMIEV